MTDDSRTSREELLQELEELRRQNAAYESLFRKKQWAISSLQNSQQIKSQILNAINDPVVYQDTDQNIVWANVAACEKLRRTLKDVLGRKCYVLWHDRDDPCPECPVLQSLTDGRNSCNNIHDHHGVIWEIHSFPTTNESGEVIGCVELARDVTLAKQEENALRKAKQLAEAADKAKSEFLANMSHELRSPMNGILGMLDLLMDSGLDQEQRDYAYTALLAGEGLLELINDILAFSKLQAEEIEVVNDSFNLRTTIKTVTDTFREQAQRKGLGMIINVDPNVPETVWGAEGRLRQILFNLIGNAIKFTHRGSVTVEACVLRTASETMPLRVLVTIADTGVGIPQESLDAIFEPFKQLLDARGAKHQGTGLGLGIVKRLADLLGGTVCVSSTPGEGSQFNVCLPVTE